MTPRDLYLAGKLVEAITAAGEALKRKPTDTSGRYFLAELLCFAGEYERADKHLDLITEQDPKAAVALALFRQLIRGEQARQQFFAEGRVPEVLGPPSPRLQRHLQASIALRMGNLAEARTLLEEAGAPEVRGTCDGRPFTGFRDLDDLCAPVLEALTSTGKYFWVPVESVESLQLRPPKRARDLLWRQAQLIIAGGPDGEVYLPCIYAGTAALTDNQLRLGRGTDWTSGDEGPIAGRGLKMFLIGDEARTILEFSEVSFESPVPVNVQEGSGDSDTPSSADERSSDV